MILICRPAPRRQQGFTLLETGMAVTLMSMILLGTMGLFMNASRSTLRATSQMNANQDSAIAMQRVINATREARTMSLPSEGTVDAPSGYSSASFMTTSGSQPIDAAMELNFPTVITIAVANGAGAAQSISQYDRTTSATHAFYYRGNANGTPNPSAGAYLWEYDTPSGRYTILSKSIDVNTANAVQFVRPLNAPVNGSAVTSTEMDMKLVCGYNNLSASGQQSVQTNEATGGANTSALTGKCVLMRNHGTDPAPGSASQQVTDHAFQPS